MNKIGVGPRSVFKIDSDIIDIPGAKINHYHLVNQYNKPKAPLHFECKELKMPNKITLIKSDKEEQDPTFTEEGNFTQNVK